MLEGMAGWLLRILPVEAVLVCKDAYMYVLFLVFHTIILRSVLKLSIFSAENF